MKRMSSNLMNAVVVALVVSVVILAGCGGGGAGSSSTLPGGGVVGGNALSTASTVSFSDSPSDRVVAFELTINSVVLKKSDGSSVTLLSSPRRVEVTHVSGTAEPLVLASIPQGTYTSATIVVSAPDVVYIDNSGHEVEKKDATATSTLNIPFSPALQVGATPPVLLIDVDARGSITLDVVTGNVTVTPTVLVKNREILGENEQEVEDGEFEHIVGQVSASSANSFSITTGSGLSLTFATDAVTSFEGVAGAANLTANMMVRVEGRTRPDGSLLAKEVELLSLNGAEAEGLITSTTGNPVSSFAIVVQDFSGTGVNSSALGTTMNVTISSGTKFRIDNGKIDLSGLNLPAFSASSLSKGQRVEAEADNAPANGTLNADSVKLQQQALIGAISAINGSQFTLTVADDSAFNLLTGKNTVRVFTQANTRVMNVAVTQGAIVRIRGLVFFDPASGTFTMVAGRITTP